MWSYSTKLCQTPVPGVLTTSKIWSLGSVVLVRIYPVFWKRKHINLKYVIQKGSFSYRTVYRPLHWLLTMKAQFYVLGWSKYFTTKKSHVSHQRWIWGFCCTRVMKHTSEGIYSGFETYGRHHQKSKTGVLVTTQKGLVSSKNVQMTTKTKKNSPSHWFIQ